VHDNWFYCFFLICPLISHKRHEFQETVMKSLHANWQSLCISPLMINIILVLASTCQKLVWIIFFWDRGCLLTWRKGKATVHLWVLLGYLVFPPCCFLCYWGALSRIVLLLLLQAKSTSYSAFLRQIFPNIQQIDSSVFA